MKSIQAAIAGNPNCGKTTLFNRLTGSRYTTGNWPGVTVERRSGTDRVNRSIQYVDLPGTYSLNPNSPEQRVAAAFFDGRECQVVLDVVDATNLARNLYLTVELVERRQPLVLVLNMMDEVKRSGMEIDLTELSAALGIPCFAVSAATGEGLDTLRTFIGRGHFENADPAALVLPSGGETAEQRYAWIDRLCARVLKENARGRKTAHVDAVLTHPTAGLPIFLVIMLALFWTVFGAPGAKLTEWSEWVVALVQLGLDNALAAVGASDWITSLVVDGIVGGVGSVLVFVPQFVLLFLGIGLLEDSGYMARAAFVMDRHMRRFGLSGKAFIPMMVGFGCNVPAIMATRALSSERERRLTVLLLPFMSCGARMPVYALLAAAFFGPWAGIVIFALYALGIFVATGTGWLLRRTLLKGPPPPFIMELPPYRMPLPANLAGNLRERVADYVRRAGTIIFAAAVLVWFLQSFTPGLVLTENPGDSLFAGLGKALSVLFAPLGLGDWRITVALLTGIAAKEAVVSTLGVLFATGEGVGALTQALSTILTPASALAMMVFVLLYVPCTATIAAMKRELRSWTWTAGAVVWELSVAWIAAFLVHAAATWIGG